MRSLIYAGIGSRETPQEILDLMKQFAYHLAKIGFTLRSGGADGADIAFESGCDMRNGAKEIYIPWNGFNGSDSALFQVTEEALVLASKFHPAWNRLSRGARLLMGRNCYQVLGKDLDRSVDFIICWTPGGKGGGGTGQAIRIAKSLDIPVYDLGEEDLQAVKFAIAQRVLYLVTAKERDSRFEVCS